MNIKPSGQQVSEWIRTTQLEPHGKGWSREQRIAELAAQWGAEQERAKWLKENAPGGWIDDLRKQAQQATPEGFVRVPLVMTQAMEEVTQQEDWQWADLLAAAEAVTEEQYNMVQAQQPPVEEPELPEPEAIRHSFDGYGWMYIDNGHGSGWRSGIDKANAEFMYTATQMHDHYQSGVRAAGNQWQPIDSAPKDGTKVLAYTNDGYKYPLVCQCVWGDGAWWPDVWESPAEPLSPTLWMPLPGAPKE